MKNLKKIVPLCLLLIFISSTLFGATSCPNQQRGNQKSRMAEFFEQKRAYLIKEVGMTKAESDQFFPLYDTLQKEKFRLHREVRDKVKKIKSAGDQVSDDSYLEAAQAMNDLRLKEAQLENDYYRKFSRMFSPQKLYKLQMAESNFNKEVLRRGGKHNGGRPQEGN